MSSDENVPYSTSKHGHQCCPKCMEEMPYILLSERMQQWAPRKHGWYCKNCHIHVLDGDLDPSGSKWERRHRQKNRSRMFASIGKVAFGAKVVPKSYLEPDPVEAVEMDIPVPEEPPVVVETEPETKRVTEQDLRNLERYLEIAKKKMSTSSSGHAQDEAYMLI